MKKTTIKVASFLIALAMLGSFAGAALAQVYIHANGGSYFTQYGTCWRYVYNDGTASAGAAPAVQICGIWSIITTTADAEMMQARYGGCQRLSTTPATYMLG